MQTSRIYRCVARQPSLPSSKATYQSVSQLIPLAHTERVQLQDALCTSHIESIPQSYLFLHVQNSICVQEGDQKKRQKHVLLVFFGTFSSDAILACQRHRRDSRLSNPSESSLQASSTFQHYGGGFIFFSFKPHEMTHELIPQQHQQPSAGQRQLPRQTIVHQRRRTLGIHCNPVRKSSFSRSL